MGWGVWKLCAACLLLICGDVRERKKTCHLLRRLGGTVWISQVTQVGGMLEGAQLNLLCSTGIRGGEAGCYKDTQLAGGLLWPPGIYKMWQNMMNQVAGTDAARAAVTLVAGLCRLRSWPIVFDGPVTFGSG
jgi:hypothetical protein